MAAIKKTTPKKEDVKVAAPVEEVAAPVEEVTTPVEEVTTPVEEVTTPAVNPETQRLLDLPDPETPAKWGFMPELTNWDEYKKHFGENTLRTFFTEPPAGVETCWTTPPEDGSKIYEMMIARGYAPVTR